MRRVKRPGCGTLLRDVRARHGLSQSDLAGLAGTSQPAISRIESGAVSPTVETLDRLLSAVDETLSASSVSLAEPPPGGSNLSIAELRADFTGLTAEQRLEQAALLSEMATGLAAGAEV